MRIVTAVRRRGSAAALGCVLALALSGCGGGGDDVAAPAASPSAASPSDDSSGAATPAPGPADPGDATLCEAIAAAAAPAAVASATLRDTPAAPGEDPAAAYRTALDAIASAATGDIGQPAAEFVRLAKEALDAGRTLAQDADLRAADGELDAFAAAACGYRKVTAFGVDYEYLQLPETLPAGPLALTLRNDGQELHQLLLQPIAAGVQDSVEDILEAGPDRIREVLGAPVVHVLARGGRSETVLATLEPGRYAVVCYIPTDSSGSEAGSGPAHHTEGMFTELTVT